MTDKDPRLVGKRNFEAVKKAYAENLFPTLDEVAKIAGVSRSTAHRMRKKMIAQEAAK